MSCRCHDTSPCNACNNGQPCNCPPDYSVIPQASPCNCCPNGYILQGATSNYPNGYCLNATNRQTIINTIPCVNCEEAIATDCVTYTGQIPIDCGNNIYGINPGDTLTTIISKMCISNPNVIMAMLSAIGTNTTVYSGFCQLVRNCPLPIGSTVPIPGAIIITFP